MTSWRTRLAVIACTLLLLVAGTAPVGAERGTYEAPSSGQRLHQVLQPSANISCERQIADSTGYYPKGTGHSLTSSGLQKQSKPAKWRISLLDNGEGHVLADQQPTPGRFQN